MTNTTISGPDLDELFDRDPLTITNTDIEAIIDLHRTRRARLAAGERVRPKKTIDLTAISDKLLANAPKAASSGTIRRI